MTFSITPVWAIHPASVELLQAALVQHHFGLNHHAIRFGGMNTPYHSARDILWEKEEQHTSAAP